MNDWEQHGQASAAPRDLGCSQPTDAQALVLAAADVERVFARAKVAARRARPPSNIAADHDSKSGASDGAASGREPVPAKPVSLLGAKRLMNASIAWARLSRPADDIAAALGASPVGLWEGGATAADCERLLAGGLPSEAEAVLLGAHNADAAPLEPCEARIRGVVLAAAAKASARDDAAADCGASAAASGVCQLSPAAMREAAVRLQWSASAVVFAAEDEDLLRRVMGPSAAALAGMRAAVQSRGVVRLLGALLALGNVAQRGSRAVGERGLAVKAFDVTGAAEAAMSCGFDGRTRAVDLLRATSTPAPAAGGAAVPSAPDANQTAAPLMAAGEALALAGVLESGAAADMDSVRGALRRLQEGSGLLAKAVRAAGGGPVPEKLASAAARAASAAAEAESAVSATEAAAARCSAFFGVPGADASPILRGLAGLLRCWAEQPAPTS